MNPVNRRREIEIGRGREREKSGNINHQTHFFFGFIISH